MENIKIPNHIKVTTITEMNINDFGIFIFSMITPFNRKIDLYIYKILFYNSCFVHRYWRWEIIDQHNLS